MKSLSMFWHADFLWAPLEDRKAMWWRKKKIGMNFRVERIELKSSSFISSETLGK